MQDHVDVVRAFAPATFHPPRSVESAPDAWADLDPDLSFEDASFAALLAWWEDKRRGRPLPSRRDLDPVEIKPHLGRVCLIEVERTPLRFRYRLFGTELARDMGLDATGRWFDEIYPPHVLAGVLACAAWIVERRAPLRTFGRVHWPDRDFYRYETVDLPLAGDDGAVAVVLRKLAVRTAPSDPRPSCRTGLARERT